MEFGEVQGHLNTGVVGNIGTEAVPLCTCVQWVPGPSGTQAAGEKSLSRRCLQVGADRARWWAFPKVVHKSV